MKNILVTYLFVVLTVFFYFDAFSQSNFDEPYRNQYHFSVPQNKMGSPLSVVYANDSHHLFYQKNPFNLTDGYYHTGYAVSDDLISWTHQKPVLQQPESAGDSVDLCPWWGTVVHNKNEQMAWINHWNKGVMKYSVDEDSFFNLVGATAGWEKLKNCEPYVFWYEEDQRWVMIAYVRAEKMMYVLNSEDGIKWIETASFEYDYGYPQLIEMVIENNAKDTRWVLITEGGRYITGVFNGETFSFNGESNIFNHGGNVGGSVVFRQEETGEYLIMSELDSEQLADLPSNGNFTFPAVVTLHSTGDTYTLHLNPIDGIESLWGKNYSWEDEKVYPGLGQNLFRRVKGNELHIKGQIKNLNSNVFSFILRTYRGERGFEIGFDVKRKLLNVFDSQLPFEIQNNEVDIEILIDRSVVEIFIDNGRIVFSKTFAPIPELDRYVLNTRGGEILLRKFQIHRLNSAW
ncbi:MAG: GH32 C-terminal domain-containing protein [Prolixibacteraceae bacterium]|jgi:fructan beta-fructosidase|nr:GH32 C-terminal domain-containing protein [Prolixibacteraceae bacterium]